MPKKTARRRQRIRWYRHPWVAFALAVVAAGLLLTSVLLRFLLGLPRTGLAHTTSTGAMFSGLFAFLLAQFALTDSAQSVPIARAFILRIFPGIDQAPPPVTPASRQWAPVAFTLGFAVFILTGLCLFIELAVELVGFIGSQL